MRLINSKSIHLFKDMSKLLGKLLFSIYSAQNNNWDWNFEVCLLLCPTLSSALNITHYQQVTTIQIISQCKQTKINSTRIQKQCIQRIT